MQRGSTTSYNTTEQNYCWYSHYSILLLHSSYGSVRNMEKSVCVCLSFKRTPFNAGSGTGSLGLTSGLEFPQRYMTYKICHLITSLLTITVTNLKALQSKKCFFCFISTWSSWERVFDPLSTMALNPAWVWWGAARPLWWWSENILTWTLVARCQKENNNSRPLLPKELVPSYSRSGAVVLKKGRIVVLKGLWKGGKTWQDISF